jgi:hypothetical protein
LVDVSQAVTADSMTEEKTHLNCEEKWSWDGCRCAAFTYTFLAWEMPRTDECQQEPSACVKNKEQDILGKQDGVAVLSWFQLKASMTMYLSHAA